LTLLTTVFTFDYFASRGKPISAVVSGLLPFVKVVDNFDAEYEARIFSRCLVESLESDFMREWSGEFAEVSEIVTV